MSFYVLSKISPAPEPVAAVAAVSSPEVLSKIPGCNIDTRTYEEIHTPDQTPEAPSPDPQPQVGAATYPALAVAMREAFDALTGTRIRQRRIADYLAANYPGAPWSDVALDYWYDTELQRRQRDRWIASLPSMPHDKLRRLERWCDRLIEEGPDGPRGKQYHAAKWQAPYVAQELASDRRRTALERTKVRRERRPAPAPKVTDVDTTPPLLALVDLPEYVTKCHTSVPMLVQAGDPVPMFQEAVQAAQDGPGAVLMVEPLYSHGTPMEAPPDGDVTPTPCMPSRAMDVPGAAHHGAVCSSLLSGPTVPAIEPIGPKATTTTTPVIIRPDLYKRCAAQRRAAAVQTIGGA